MEHALETKFYSKNRRIMVKHSLNGRSIDDIHWVLSFLDPVPHRPRFPYTFNMVYGITRCVA